MDDILQIHVHNYYVATATKNVHLATCQGAIRSSHGTGT